jgi:hypothetical protein
MAGSFECLQANAAEFEDVAVRKRGETVFCFGFGAEVDGGAHAVAQFEMAGDEVGVKMGQEHVLDLEIVFGGDGQVLVDVPLGIDNGGGARFFIADQV